MNDRMNPEGEGNQRVFERNLREIGRRVAVPDAPHAARQAGWKRAEHDAGTDQSRDRHRRGERFRLNAARLAAGGALAATLMLVIWLTVSPRGEVSAETIFLRLAEQMTGAVWIEIENADFGVSVLDGRIYREPNPDEQGAFRTLFSEIAVRMRPDNPDWRDYEGLAARYQHETGSWRFYRGHGTGKVEYATDGRLHMTPMETMYVRDGWPARPIDHTSSASTLLGAIPISMGVTFEGSSVRYTATVPGQDLFSEVMNVLDDLIDPASAEALLARMVARAENVRINVTDDGIMRLTSRGIRHDRPEPAVAFFDATYHYHPDRAVIGGSSSSHLRVVRGERNAALVETQNRMVRHLTHKSGQMETLLDALETVAERVDIDRSNPDEWLIRARDIRIVEGQMGVHSMAPEMDTFLAGIDIVIDFDPRANLGGRVIRAEFRGIGHENGVIRVRPAAEPLDPALIDYERLISEQTRIVEID